MGTKKIKYDTTCPYCCKRYNLEELKEEGYTDETKVGTVVTCKNTKCESQFIIEK